MPTYFPTLSGESTDSDADYIYLKWRIPVVCPGSGNQIVKELSFHCYNAVAGAHVRLALYDSTGSTKICEGTAEVSVGTGSLAWVGHTTQASMTPNPCTIVGGTSYIIAVSHDAVSGNSFYYGYNSPGGTQGYYIIEDDTGGMPASVSGGTADTQLIWVRCGVDPAEESSSSSSSSSLSSSSRNNRCK